jgi:serine protease AprX
MCAGDGRKSNGELRGAAPKAKLFFQSILDVNGGLGGLPSDLRELFNEAYEKGVAVWFCQAPPLRVVAPCK